MATLTAGTANHVLAQQQEYELTGNLSFDVSQFNGVVRSAAITIGDGGTGPYKAVMAGDTSLTTHTIYRPADLNPFGPDNKLPIVTWGNGGCRNGSGEVRNFLSEIASHGFFIVAIGPIGNSLTGTGEFGTTTSKQLLDALDWATAENEREGSTYYGKLDTGKVAVMGQSCGGLQALDVMDDPRFTTTVLWNSGVLPALPQGQSEGPRFLPEVTKADLEKLQGPVAYFLGGKHDIATPNGSDDFSRINHVPALLADYDFSEEVSKTGNQDLGHYPATYREPNGGDFALAGVAWLKWTLKGDIEAAKMLTGNDCGLCENKKWSVNVKGM